MSKLEQVFEAMRPYLLREKGIEETVAVMGPVDPKRLAIYRRFVKAHEDDVLEKVFSATRRALPEAQWNALGEAYFKAHPLFDWEFNGNGAHFPTFVRARLEEDAALPRFLGDLVDAEWTELSVRLDGAEHVTKGAAVLNPTLALRQLAFDVLPFAHEESTEPPSERPHLRVFFRHAESLDVESFEPAARDLVVLKMLSEDLPIEDVAKAAGVPHEAVARWVVEAKDQGWVEGEK